MRMPSTARGTTSRSPAPAPRLPALARRGAGLARRLWTAARGWPALARTHWLLTALLAVGLAMRVLTQIAYRPALLYIDSTKYLLGAYPGNDPPGYEFTLKPVLLVGNLDLVAAVQHLLGLGMAVTIAAVLLRRGAPRWLAALAAAPVLLDGYQLQIEQTVMPDVMFESLIVAGVAALLWRRRPNTTATVIAGLALGASATARQVGEILLLPALVYLALAVTGWRRLLRHAAILAAAFSLPILIASYRNYVAVHRFSLAPYASGSIYGRMAEAANCQTLRLPAYERPLCPDPQQKRLGPDGLNHQASSPIKYLVAPPGMRTAKLASDFARRVLSQQPLNVAEGIGADALKLFSLRRATSPGDTAISRWQFQRTFPQYPPYVVIGHGAVVFGTFTADGAEQTIGTSSQFGGGTPVAVRPLASFLRAYQLDGGYTPGPLFALMAVAGLAGSIAAFRRRRPLAQAATSRACLLFFTAGAAALLASDVFEFSWRYQLPALVTLPPAAALTIAALLPRSAAATPGEVVPHLLEPGQGGHNHGGERDQRDGGQPTGGGGHHNAAGERPGDNGRQHADAAGAPRPSPGA